MSLSSAIYSARSGLQVSSLRAEIVATNVANASTPGYVRRSANLSETIVGGNSAGVRADGISRVNDTAIKAQRRELTSDLAQASVLSSTWKSISTRIGDSAAGNGLFKNFSDFETALARSISAPESLTRAFGAAGHALWTACIAEAERGVAARLNAQEERLKAMENRIQALEGLLAANHSSRAGALSAQPPFPSRSNAT